MENEPKNPLENIRVSAIVSLLLLGLALTFSLMGFFNARNSYIDPTIITIYMLVSAALFFILAVRGLRRKEMWQRMLGVSAAAAGVFMVFFAFMFFYVLRNIYVPPNF